MILLTLSEKHINPFIYITQYIKKYFFQIFFKTFLWFTVLVGFDIGYGI